MLCATKEKQDKVYRPSDKHALDGVWIASLLAQIQQRKFYGRLILIFEEGTLHRALKEESLHPPHRTEVKGE